MSRIPKSKRKQRSNIPLRTSGQNQQTNNTDKIEKATKTWQLILAGCSLVGAGFAGGIYVGNNNSKIEYQDKITEYRERIIEIEKMHEKEIHDLNHEIFELKGENNELKQQIRELKIKKR